MKNPFSPDNKGLPNITIRRAASALSTELDGETVILDVASGMYSGLDQVGTIIWNRLEQPASFKELKDIVVSNYEVSENQCHKDLCSFLADLLRNRLIETDDGPTD